MRLKGFVSLRVVRSVSIVMSCATIAVLGSAFFSEGHLQVSRDRRQGSSTGSVKTDNKTRAFSIVNAKRRGDIVEVEIRNDYDKPITGFQVSVGDATIQTELLVGDEIRVLAPGEVTLKTYGAPPELEERGIVVLAVLFNDHTGDGDSWYLNRLLEYRKGMKMQRQQTIQALQRVLSLSDVDLPQGFDKLVSQSFSLSEEDIKRLPMPVQLGIKDERRRLLRSLATIKGATDGIKVAAETQAFYRDKLASLVGNYSQTLDSL